MERHRLIDFHAHHPSLRGERVIEDGKDTRGRHPWHLGTPQPPFGGEETPQPPSGGENSQFIIDSSILAIGESGLDRVCQTPYDLQLRVFREEVELSERLGKPLILHCVRAVDDVLAVRHEMGARQPWIWHGYRGNAQQLRQLLNLPRQAVPIMGEAERGAFYFSFGRRFNSEALVACPADRLLLETDDDTEHPIADLYAEVARLRQTSVGELTEQMNVNFDNLFVPNYH